MPKLNAASARIFYMWSPKSLPRGSQNLCALAPL